MTARSQKPGFPPRGPSRAKSGLKSQPNAQPKMPSPQLAFSRPVDVRRLPDPASRHDIEASEAERAALAKAFAVPAIASLRAQFELRPRAGGRVVVTGLVEAVVTQLCVVTLEAFDSRVAQQVDLVFAPETQEQFDDRRRRDDRDAEPSARSVPGSDDQVDPPDVIIDDVVDLGVIAAEFTALALDPYPRKPGAAFDDVTDPGDVDEPSAFAALERLKERS